MPLVKITNSAYLLKVRIEFSTWTGNFLSFVESLNALQVLIQLVYGALLLTVVGPAWEECGTVEVVLGLH